VAAATGLAVQYKISNRLKLGKANRNIRNCSATGTSVLVPVNRGLAAACQFNPVADGAPTPECPAGSLQGHQGGNGPQGDKKFDPLLPEFFDRPDHPVSVLGRIDDPKAYINPVQVTFLPQALFHPSKIIFKGLNLLVPEDYPHQRRRLNEILTAAQEHKQP